MPDAAKDPLDHFVGELLLAAKLDALPDDAREEVATRLRDQAERRIGIIAVEHLDDAGLDQFNQLLGRESPPSQKEMQDFFASHIEDFAAKMSEALSKFASEFIAASQKRAPAEQA
jgi:hypothetical protein